MAINLKRSTKERMTFVSSIDSAVDVSTDELKEHYREYLYHHDVSRLTLTGEPVKWILRPLTNAVYEKAIQETRGIAVPRLYVTPTAARRLVMYSCEKIEGPPQDGWPDSPHRVYDLWLGLEESFASDLPTALCLEAAEMLLSTLPLMDVEEPDPRNGVRVGKDASIKKKSNSKSEKQRGTK